MYFLVPCLLRDSENEEYVAHVTLLTYPVSTCTAERSFSGVMRLKNPSSKADYE